MHYVAHAPYASVHVRYDSAQDMLIARGATRIMQCPWTDTHVYTRYITYTPAAIAMGSKADLIRVYIDTIDHGEPSHNAKYA